MPVSFIGGWNQSTRRKTQTCRYTSPWAGFKLTTLVVIGSAVLTHGHAGQLPGAPDRANLCMLCTACFFLMFKHWFCWKYQYNKYMFNFIDTHSFILVSGCVDTDPPGHCFFPGAYYAVNTVLVIGTDCIWSCKYNLLKSIQDAQHQMHTYSSNKSLLLWNLLVCVYWPI